MWEEIREDGEVGENDVGEHLQHSSPINLQDIHMLYGDEGFEEDSNELENWEDDLEFIGGRLVFHPGLKIYVSILWNIILPKTILLYYI